MKDNCKRTKADARVRAPLRMLIVDDSNLIVFCMRQLLEREAQIEVVDTAANGHEALQKAGELAPDLVVMDLRMPVMGGLEATAAMRSRMPGTRIIIMTLEDSLKNKAAARAHGAHGFVAKFHLAAELMPEIRRVFRLPGGR